MRVHVFSLFVFYLLFKVKMRSGKFFTEPNIQVTPTSAVREYGFTPVRIAMRNIFAKPREVYKIERFSYRTLPYFVCNFSLLSSYRKKNYHTYDRRPNDRDRQNWRRRIGIGHDHCGRCWGGSHHTPSWIRTTTWRRLIW